MKDNSKRGNEESRAYQEGLHAGINLPAKKLKNPKCPYEERDLISATSHNN